MSKINLLTLAANAARAKLRLSRQEAKLKRLTDQLINRVGTGGQTLQTSLGQVIVTAQTFDRDTANYAIIFDREAFDKLSPRRKQLLVEEGVVRMEKINIRGTDPKVQFRLVEKL